MTGSSPVGGAGPADCSHGRRYAAPSGRWRAVERVKRSRYVTRAAPGQRTEPLRRYALGQRGGGDYRLSEVMSAVRALSQLHNRGLQAVGL